MAFRFRQCRCSCTSSWMSKHYFYPEIRTIMGRLSNVNNAINISRIVDRPPLNCKRLEIPRFYEPRLKASWIDMPVVHVSGPHIPWALGICCLEHFRFGAERRVQTNGQSSCSVKMKSTRQSRNVGETGRVQDKKHVLNGVFKPFCRYEKRINSRVRMLFSTNVFNSQMLHSSPHGIPRVLDG